MYPFTCQNTTIKLTGKLDHNMQKKQQKLRGKKKRQNNMRIYNTHTHTHTHTHIYISPALAKRGLNASAKSIDPGQPALGRNYSLQVNFLYVQGPVYLVIKSAVTKNGYYGSVSM